ncbi:MAG: hypothetical protein M9911_06785 [Saprospiraceae bacterium]|nr:hypothetical protein [Saprospiraceae bacterium]
MKRAHTEVSRKTEIKELDYRKRRTDVFFKPPCGAFVKSKGIERQGQNKFILACRSSDCMV